MTEINLPRCESKNQNAKQNKAVLPNSFIGEINSRFIIVIHFGKTLNMYESCKKKLMVFLKKNSLVTIPDNCNLTIKATTFKHTKVRLIQCEISISNIPMKIRSLDLQNIKCFLQEADSIVN